MPVRLEVIEESIEEINKIFEIAQERFENQQNIPEEVVEILPDLKSKLGSLVKALEETTKLSITYFPPLMELIKKLFILKIELPDQLKNSLSKLLNSFKNIPETENDPLSFFNNIPRKDIEEALKMIKSLSSDNDDGISILGEGWDETDV